jgi:type I restriction enzyme S subunit
MAFLNAEIMRSEVRKLAQGGTQIYINFGSVLSINFFLPCLEEQTKIANFLSAIDQKIDVVQNN